MISFYQYAREYPPILVRLLARHKGGLPLTTSEISCRCAGHGWPMSSYRIGIISSALDWDEIPFGEMQAFLLACDVDFTDPVAMNRKKTYLKSQHKFRYLIKSPEFHTILKPLVARYREHIEKQINHG
ncbi:MAG TPA: hypothetical protein VNU68_29155 [Verrucomicrobiae bacterium]|nr:hypothetical protein [Verrucomicrobiae bacterium]